MTNPEERMDPWREALSCYEEFADEVITVGKEWPEEFEWSYIAKVFNEGYTLAKGDWVIRMDIDYFFHEKDLDYLRNFLEENNDKPAVAFRQLQFFNPFRYQKRHYICLAVNKKKFPEIKLNGGGDGLLPAIDGKLIEPHTVPLSKASIWNYECMFKTKEIISSERARFARAWFKTYGHWINYGSGEEEEAFNAWMKIISERYPKHIYKLQIDDHPIYIRNKLLNLREDQFGYDCFGLNSDFKVDFLEYFREVKRNTKFT